MCSSDLSDTDADTDSDTDADTDSDTDDTGEGIGYVDDTGEGKVPTGDCGCSSGTGTEAGMVGLAIGLAAISRRRR